MTAPLPPLLLRGDCMAELARIPDESVDAVVTDPLYGLEFMGKAWDKYTPLDFELWCAKWAAECRRILKPGGHLLAFGGSRTWHRLAAGIEDAGFEIRDSIAWLYGSGFPKSLDVSKAIDKAAGATREKVGEMIRGPRSADAVTSGASRGGVSGGYNFDTVSPITAPATDAAREWEGWGTALKPAFEPVVVARKPLGEKTVAANVLAHGTGALNIDATRIGTDGGTSGGRGGGMHQYDGFSTLAELRAAAERGEKCPRGQDARATLARVERNAADANVVETGRWPANVALDEDQAAALDEQAPKTGAAAKASGPTLRGRHDTAVAYGARNGLEGEPAFHGDTGGASRFFYVAPIDELEERFIYGAKAPKSERPVVDGTAHPTVKPLALMRWLIRLVTPPGGCVVDPFAGSGTTLEAAYLEGFEAIGVEMTPEYWPLVAARIERVTK